MGGGRARQPAPAASSGMILGVDTDVLVHWAMADAPHHLAVRRCFQREIRRGRRLGLTLQVLQEFLHVATDPGRFEHPMDMKQALGLSLELWTGREVERLLPTTRAHDRLCELMDRLQLGRRRILDTSLAVTLEAAGVTRLATFNGRDFVIFSFLEIVDPTDGENGGQAHPGSDPSLDSGLTGQDGPVA